MIDYSQAKIQRIIYNRINGNSVSDILSDTLYTFEGEDEEDVKKIFLKPFANHFETNEFKHAISIDLNPLYTISEAIFKGKEFVENALHIHQHLKSVSKHPNIKEGDLFVIHYDNIRWDNGYHEAIGIYKIENKERFLETTSNDNGEATIALKKGIGSKKLDKACLIINTEKPYTVFLIDNVSSETDYWRNDFIGSQPKKDFINDTNQFLSLTKSFVTEQMPSEFNVSKTEQIDLLNRSMDYFKSQDEFNMDDFNRDVIHHPEVIDAFNNYKKKFETEKEVDIADSFEISVPAVKKQARVFKSVLKLDKNFHIYIHGDRQLIEQGIESDGRKYYKIYFNQEL